MIKIIARGKIMHCRVSDMRNKEVIHVKTGMRLGCVNDVEIDTKNAKILGIIVFGRLKCFGIFGREDDLFIRWEEIEVIGEDTVLVGCDIAPLKRKRKFFMQKFFRS